MSPEARELVNACLNELVEKRAYDNLARFITSLEENDRRQMTVELPGLTKHVSEQLRDARKENDRYGLALMMIANGCAEPAAFARKTLDAAMQPEGGKT